MSRESAGKDSRVESKARKRELADKRATLRIPAGSVLYERVVPIVLVLLALILAIVVLIVVGVVVRILPYR